MTDDEYRAGLQELLLVFDNLEIAPTEDNYYDWYDYGTSLIQDALEDLNKTRTIH